MMDLTRRTFLGSGAALAAISAPMPVFAAPAARLIDGPWKRFGSNGDPDYGTWANFLRTYVDTSRGDGITRVAYGRAAGAGARLSGQIASLAAIDPTTLSRDAAMAYWINLYNIITVDLVLAEWPVKSIKEVRGGLFNTGPWDVKVVKVAGRDLSLDEIEHGILRPVWRDARIHYGVNCASIGCPNLAAKPYTAGALDQMLSAGARAYVGHPRGVSRQGGDLTVSKIYDWFIEDFGGNTSGILAHLNAHAATPIKGRITDYAYDWSLNGASTARSS